MKTIQYMIMGMLLSAACSYGEILTLDKDEQKRIDQKISQLNIQIERNNERRLKVKKGRDESDEITKMWHQGKTIAKETIYAYNNKEQLAAESALSETDQEIKRLNEKHDPAFYERITELKRTREQLKRRIKQ